MTLLPAAKIEVAWCGEKIFTPVIDLWKKYLLLMLSMLAHMGGERATYYKEQRIRKNYNVLITWNS